MIVGAVVRPVLRNRPLRRLAVTHLLFIATEYGVWIAVLVYAYARGGTAQSGGVALLQLLPAAALAPFFATLADRFPPARVLAAGLAMQAVGMAAAGAAMAGHRPWAAYGGAVVATVAVGSTRPAEATLLPAVARSAQDLTAVNVVMGWSESVGIVLGSAAVGVLLGISGPAAAELAGAAAAAGAAAMVLPVRSRPMRGDDVGSSATSQLLVGLRLLRATSPPRTLVSVLAVDWVIVGALDVLFVVIAISVLSEGQEWVGYLNTAYGAGGILAGGLSVLLVGRRLGPVILTAALLSSGMLALTASGWGPAATAALLAVAGGGRAVLDVCARTLLQRAVPAEVLGAIFGLLEGVTTAGLAAGAVLTPLLVHLWGAVGALYGISALLPVLLLAGSRRLFAVDAGASVPVVEIALLRSVPLFRELPAPALAGVARALERLELPAGAILIRQGEPGERYYVIADGEVGVTVSGAFCGTRDRGDGIGEIALLRQVPRTATVTARSPLTVYALDRGPFLAAVTRHAPTLSTAERIAAERSATPAASAER